MTTLLETLLDRDENISHQEVLQIIADNQHTIHEMFVAIISLTPSKHIRVAYMLAMMLTNRGYDHFIISMALSVGGHIHNNPTEKERGLQGLRTHSENLTTEQQRYFFDSCIYPVSIFLLERTLGINDNDQLLNILETSKAADPALRKLFDWDAPEPKLLIEEIRQQGRERAKLLPYSLPPSDAPQQQRRVLVTGRKTFFQRGSNSRLFDIGPRMVAAITHYGWHAELYDIDEPRDENHAIVTYHTIVELCRHKRYDVLILDDEILVGLHDHYMEMLNQLRQITPSLKIVGYRLDTWEVNFYEARKLILEATASHLDLLWDFTTPSLPLWKKPELANKVLCMPPPFAWNHGSVDKPLIPHLLFAGSIKGFNWHRAFWIAAMEHLKLPFTKKISTHLPDDLPPLVSYHYYMKELAEATCSLSLAMRPDYKHTCIVTGRSYEILLSGSLLVQEAAPDMDHFLIAGEHYLEFSSVAELSAIMRFITENRQEAEEIRRRGHAFVKERYSDKNIIGYLDKALFFQD